MKRRFPAAIAIAIALPVLATPAVAAAAGAPGHVIRSKPYEAQVLPGVAMPGKAYKIFYKSTSATGHPVTVSGSVLVPPDPAPGHPLVGYAIGTQGLADRCAPSAQLASGGEYEASLVQMALTQGWTIALTDYPGLGTGGEHPYVVGKALGRSVLDSMRAARNLPAANLRKRGPAALMATPKAAARPAGRRRCRPATRPT